MTEVPNFTTGLGVSNPDQIRLFGQDLCTELIDKIGFGELAFWFVTGYRPTAGQSRVFEAVLVALADHGLTPIALASRLTFLGAPEAIQGAIAAGLLGGGSRYLGVTEDTALFLSETLARARSEQGELPTDAHGWDQMAIEAMHRRHNENRLVPGLGHPIHKQTDPRTEVIAGVARASGCYGAHLELFTAVGRNAEAVLGRQLPMNGAGVCGAALADAGVPVQLLRGVSLLARTAGLLGHLREELDRPIAPDLYMFADRNARYEPPGG